MLEGARITSRSASHVIETRETHCAAAARAIAVRVCIFTHGPPPMQYEIGKEALRTGGEYVTAQFDRIDTSGLRRYFDIDNATLFAKLRAAFVPLPHTAMREAVRPDLYIPAMSLLVLVLLKGFKAAGAPAFSFEAVLLSCSRLTTLQVVAVLCYRAACYVVGAEGGLMDLLAISGTKYTVAVLMRLLLCLRWGRLLALYPLGTLFFSMSRALNRAMGAGHGPRRRVYLLFMIVVFEMFMTLLAVR